MELDPRVVNETVDRPLQVADGPTDPTDFVGDHGVEVAALGIGHHLAVAVAVRVCSSRLVSVDFDIGEVGSEVGPGVVLGRVELAVEVLVSGRNPAIAGNGGHVLVQGHHPYKEPGIRTGCTRTFVPVQRGYCLDRPILFMFVIKLQQN